MTVRFAFVVPTRNSIATLEQALLSLAGQSHRAWRAVVVDDCSDDGTPDAIRIVAQELGIASRLTLIESKTRRWEIANTLLALERVGSDEVVCRLDLDDYLCDLNALEIVAKAYDADPELDVVWTAHRWFDSNGITTTNVSADMPAAADPYVHPWCASHLKTWRKSVLDGVSDANFRGQDGEHFKRIGDQAFMLPALERARKRRFLPFAAYAYRCDMSPETFSTDDARFQRDEALYLRARGFVP